MMVRLLISLADTCDAISYCSSLIKAPAKLIFEGKPANHRIDESVTLHLSSRHGAFAKTSTSSLGPKEAHFNQIHISG